VLYGAPPRALRSPERLARRARDGDGVRCTSCGRRHEFQIVGSYVGRRVGGPPPPAAGGGGGGGGGVGGGGGGGGSPPPPPFFFCPFLLTLADVTGPEHGCWVLLLISHWSPEGGASNGDDGGTVRESP
jgi:hypothetical protein